MCGRATLTNEDINEVLRELDAEIAADDRARYRPRYNIAPSDLHWMVEPSGDGRVMSPAMWGYRPPGRPPLINVRGEQVAAGHGFRRAFESHRCVVVTDGFFEWDKQHRPFWYHRPDGGLVLLAGIYQLADKGDGQTERRFTILTTRPNRLVAQVHDRMPVVIGSDRLDDWLTAPPERVGALIAPADDQSLIVTAVSGRVNSVKHDDPACLAPPGAPAQGTLF